MVVEGAEAARGFAQLCRGMGRGPRQGRHGFDLRIDKERGTGHRAPSTGHRAPSTGPRAPGTGHRAPGSENEFAKRGQVSVRHTMSRSAGKVSCSTHKEKL